MRPLNVIIRLFIYQYYLIVAIVLITIIALLTAKTQSIKMEHLLAGVASVLTFVIALNRESVDHHRARRKFFCSYNKRYDELNSMLNEIVTAESDNKLTKGSLEPQHTNNLNDYFNLCSEEYHGFKDGDVDIDVWCQWCVGIKQYLDKSKIIHALFIEDTKKGSFYGLTREIVMKYASKAK
jgi:hypothetical protein